MSDPGDVERRLSSLEREVAELREQVALVSTEAAAARVLAAGADRDVSEVRAELRAHTQALNALRETQLEQQATQLEQRRALQELQNGMADGFATLRTGMSQVVSLLEGRN